MSSRLWQWRQIDRACYLTLAALVWLGGCRQSEFPLVPVSGTVTFDGGACPAAGNVTFQPLDIPEGLPKRPASGKFGTDGSYSVNSFNGQEGVLPGRYRVDVSCFAGGPDFSKSDPWADVNYIAADYTPAELTIDADAGSVVYDIDVPRRKGM